MSRSAITKPSCRRRDRPRVPSALCAVRRPTAPFDSNEPARPSVKRFYVAARYCQTSGRDSVPSLLRVRRCYGIQTGRDPKVVRMDMGLISE
jgi:hypothetical protein